MRLAPSLVGNDGVERVPIAALTYGPAALQRVIARYRKLPTTQKRSPPLGSASGLVLQTRHDDTINLSSARQARRGC